MKARNVEVVKQNRIGVLSSLIVMAFAFSMGTTLEAKDGKLWKIPTKPSEKAEELKVPADKEATRWSEILHPKDATKKVDFGRFSGLLSENPVHFTIALKTALLSFKEKAFTDFQGSLLKSFEEVDVKKFSDSEKRKDAFLRLIEKISKLSEKDLRGFTNDEELIEKLFGGDRALLASLGLTDDEAKIAQISIEQEKLKKAQEEKARLDAEAERLNKQRLASDIGEQEELNQMIAKIEAACERKRQEEKERLDQFNKMKKLMQEVAQKTFQPSGEELAAAKKDEELDKRLNRLFGKDEKKDKVAPPKESGSAPVVASKDSDDKKEDNSILKSPSPQQQPNQGAQVMPAATQVANVQASKTTKDTTVGETALKYARSVSPDVDKAVASLSSNQLSLSSMLQPFSPQLAAKYKTEELKVKRTEVAFNLNKAEAAVKNIETQLERVNKQIAEQGLSESAKKELADAEQDLVKKEAALKDANRNASMGLDENTAQGQFFKTAQVTAQTEFDAAKSKVQSQKDANKATLEQSAQADKVLIATRDSLETELNNLKPKVATLTKGVSDIETEMAKNEMMLASLSQPQQGGGSNIRQAIQNQGNGVAARTRNKPTAIGTAAGSIGRPSLGGVAASAPVLPANNGN